MADSPRARSAGAPPFPVAHVSGATLVEAVVALALLSLLALVVAGQREAFDQWSIARAARLTERHLSGARLNALAHRRPVQVRLAGPRVLETVDAGGRVVARLDLERSGLAPLDSIRVRPSRIRYNPRGHGSAGSVYLYRGHRGVRVVSNFIGRIRRHGFRF